MERISEPIIRMKGDKAYIFIYKDVKTEKFISQHQEVQKQLQEDKIEVVQIGIEIHDYIQVIQNISKIVKAEREANLETEIFINISVGTKITAIAAMDACRFWDCTPYYVQGEEYMQDTSSKGALSSGAMDIFLPPIFKVQKPAAKLIDALRIIAEKDGIYKKEFLKKLLSKKILVIQKQYDIISK